MAEVKVGDMVIYTDPVGTSHLSLVTAVWDPSINVVYVDDDETKTDSYGRQIARNTSVLPHERQTAPGNFWDFP